MYYFVLTVHVIACVALIMIVLLQSGKGAGFAGLFGGGGGSDQLFSASSGMVFIKKVTVIVAVLFVFTSLFLTVFTARKELMSVTSRIPAIPVAPPPHPAQ